MKVHNIRKGIQHWKRVIIKGNRTIKKKRRKFECLSIVDENSIRGKSKLNK